MFFLLLLRLLLGVPLVRVRVRGTSFLYNQIRYMVGAAVAVARGVLPAWHLDAAMQAPFSVPVPLAPPTGLLLVNAGFGSYAKAHVCYNSSPSSIATTTTTTTQETGSYGSKTNTRRKNRPNSDDMEDERLSPFCSKALRAYGAKVGPTPEGENEEEEDLVLSCHSRPQPNHRRGDHHRHPNQHSSSSSFRTGPSDRKRVQNDQGGLPVVELMDAAAYAETTLWQVHAAQAH